MRKSVLVRGPALTQSGYGEHTRFVLRALRAQEDKFDIHVLPTTEAALRPISTGYHS